SERFLRCSNRRQRVDVVQDTVNRLGLWERPNVRHQSSIVLSSLLKPFFAEGHRSKNEQSVNRSVVPFQSLRGGFSGNLPVLGVLVQQPRQLSGKLRALGTDWHGFNELIE